MGKMTQRLTNSPTQKLINSFLCCTIGTNTLQYIVDVVERKPVGQWHNRYGYVLETECTMAAFTIEMRVFVVYRAVA